MCCDAEVCSAVVEAIVVDVVDEEVFGWFGDLSVHPYFFSFV